MYYKERVVPLLALWLCVCSYNMAIHAYIIIIKYLFNSTKMTMSRTVITIPARTETMAVRLPITILPASIEKNQSQNNITDY